MIHRGRSSSDVTSVTSDVLVLLVMYSVVLYIGTLGMLSFAIKRTNKKL